EGSRMMKAINRYTNKLTLLSGLLIAVGFMLMVMQQQTDWSTGFLIAATVIGVAPVAMKAWQAVSLRTFSIELLVTIAVVGALFIREYVESSIVTFLFLFGAYLENRTLQKTRSSLKQLIDMAPQEALKLNEDGSRESISVDDVQVGDRLAVLPGGKIPVDGMIVQGRASINEAAITGESVPVNKSLDDRVFSGSMLDSGYVELIAEKVGDD